jgi:CRP-like cAMP-binding protein
VSSAKAITAVTAYELPLEALQHSQSKDPDFAFHVIEKLCHSLRRAQHHAALLTERHALAKLAIFLELQEHIESMNKTRDEIYLPMNRSSIAGYVGMTLAAVC